MNQIEKIIDIATWNRREPVSYTHLLDQMIYHAKSVVRGVKRAMVVVDMPFGSYQGNEMEGLASAIRLSLIHILSY